MVFQEHYYFKGNQDFDNFLQKKFYNIENWIENSIQFNRSYRRKKPMGMHFPEAAPFPGKFQLLPKNVHSGYLRFFRQKVERLDWEKVFITED